VTAFQADIVIALLVTIAVLLVLLVLQLPAFHDALHTLILQGNQRREWNRKKDANDAVL